ncbi:MAG TPA: ABC transporter substrate-binding protein/permease [Gemmatimonadales bacterium]|nr:ABC transporter substrate-binding protein/permease [Gemmatimonadales bacterium]
MQGSGSHDSVLVWGGDAEGGAPFVEADPANPARVRGFDVEVAERIARGLGRRSARFVQVQWSSIDQSVERRDFSIGLSGVEDTPIRRARHAVTLPYFEFREVLAIRPTDQHHIRELADLRGKRVATLGATIAYDLLLAVQDSLGLTPVSYDDDVHPYTDLVSGRVDAVLLDHIIAQRALRRLGGGDGMVILPQAVATGHYVGVLPRADSVLRDSVDAVLREAMRDGTLEQIFRRWDVWDSSQGVLFERTLRGGATQAARATVGGAQGVMAYLPSLARAAGVTLSVSVLSMGLAVIVGLALASARVYGSTVLRVLATIYIEVVRGTPLLLQLFVIYYGLSGVVRLPAFLAAVLALGFNYGAYEAEIYRGALQAVARAQLEAARTLGFTEGQILRLIRGPQAVRYALAPMTNDFVALLKDSALVSVITVVELTKQTAIFATNVGSWVVPGILCAIVYLAMSLPLSQLARRLERRWGVHAA